MAVPRNSSFYILIKSITYFVSLQPETAEKQLHKLVASTVHFLTSLLCCDSEANQW